MQKISPQILWSIVYIICGGLVFILGLNLLKIIPQRFHNVYKISLPILFLALYFLSLRFFPKQEAVFLAFFLVSIGWLLDFYLSGVIKDWLSLNTQKLSGLAYTMLVSTILVSTPVLVGWWVSGHDFSSIFVQGSTRTWGIVVGLVGLVLFGGLGVLQALDQGLAVKVIGAAVPLVLVFSLSNAFREELAYRAVFLKGYQENIGLIAAIIVTTLIFALAHVEVNYFTASTIVFAVILVLIGIVGSLIMLKTGSLTGAMLFHAGADVLLVMGMLASGQLVLK